jgi:hypothetical protein
MLVNKQRVLAPRLLIEYIYDPYVKAVPDRELADRLCGNHQSGGYWGLQRIPRHVDEKWTRKFILV